MAKRAGSLLRLAPVMLLSVLMSVSSLRADDTLYLATSTTIHSSGLLSRVEQAFSQASGHKLRSMATGSGRALFLARQGQVDIVWTNLPVEESAFVEQGVGLSRHVVMMNDYLLVGPAGDPAGVNGEADILTAMRKISDSRQVFISRADDSGTHRMELALWEQLGLSPYAGWYFEAGCSSAEALRLAHEKQAYTLVDRGTWLMNRQGLSLKVLSRGDQRLRNVYSVTVVDPRAFSRRHTGHGGSFAQWLLGEEGRALIASMRVDGEPLFDLPDSSD